MALASSTTPNRGTPYITGIHYRTVTPVTKTLTTAGGVITLTAAELLCGLLRVDCQDAQTLNFPTATAILAAIPGPQVGTTFEVDILNYGDTTLTIGLNTGVTLFAIGSVDAVLTMATFVAKRFTFRVTSITEQGGADAIEVYGYGSTAAALS